MQPLTGYSLLYSVKYKNCKSFGILLCQYVYQYTHSFVFLEIAEG